MPINKAYGCRPDLADQRDHVCTVEAPASKLPLMMDLQPGMPPIRDQNALGCCFSGETEVSLLDGTVDTLRNLSERISEDPLWVYSCNPDTGGFIPAVATAHKTRTSVHLLRVTLDNGLYIDCTEDHNFLTRDGLYVEAQDLKPDDSLMPLYKALAIEGDELPGYEMIFQNDKLEWTYTHRLTCPWGKGSVRHHKNFNRTDNRPDNLQMMTWEDHNRLHVDNVKEMWACASEEKRAAMLKALKEYNGSEAQRKHSRDLMNALHEKGPEWRSSRSSKGGKNAWQRVSADPQRKQKALDCLGLGHTPESREKAKATQQITMAAPEFKKKQSDRLKAAYRASEKMQRAAHQNGKNIGGVASLRFQILKFARKVLEEEGSLNEVTWEICRCRLQNTYKARVRFGRNTVRKGYKPPRWETVIREFGTEDAVIEAAEVVNHKVVSVEPLDGLHDTYCLSVPDTENFALAAGVYVHNCTGFGTAAVFEFEQMRQKLPVFAPSPLFIYYNERQLEGTVPIDAGAEIRDGIKAIARWGAAPEASWPYDISRFATAPPAEAYADAAPHTAVLYERVPQTLRSMMGVLASGLPIVFGMTVYESFESDEVARTGMVPLPQPQEKVVGGHCFTGDTKVSLLDGRELTFIELVNEFGFSGQPFWVYSCKEDGTIVPGLAHSPRRTGESQKLLMVTLDNGEEIRCTPDHLFMSREGIYVKACELSAGYSLMPLYRRPSEDERMPDYEQLYDVKSKQWKYTHRVVMSDWHDGWYDGVVHHIDFNKFNNSPDNLEVMSWEDHTKLHADMLVEYNRSEKGRETSRQNMKKLWDDPEWRAKMLATTQKNFARGAEKLKREGRHGWAGMDKDKLRKMCSEAGKKGKGRKVPQEVIDRIQATKKKIREEDPEKRAIAATTAANNLKSYNEKLKSGEISISENQRNARRLNGARCTYRKYYEDMFDTFEEYLECRNKNSQDPILYNNHKVVSVEECGEEDVYDLTVETYHNFALSAGVFVHNCMVMCGYRTDWRTFKVRNSWGADWGRQGYCHIPFEYLLNSDLASDFWVVRIVK